MFQPGEEGTQLFSFGGSITSVDSDLKQPHTDEFTAGVEFEAPGIFESAAFIHRQAP